jgi:formamidopyrimidine-DNA glycosylase
MPELPEVEILARHLEPLLKNKTIQTVIIRRAKVVQPIPPPQLCMILLGAKFIGVRRRGKYLMFGLCQPALRQRFILLGHLGLTGRMYLLPAGIETPKHAAVELHLGRHNFVYEDQRYFGRLTLDTSPLEKLGPEPFAAEFSADYLGQALQGCKQAIKVKLLDQSLVAGIGNIYACEALFCAGISPRRPAGRLKLAQMQRLCNAIRQVLSDAIKFGSTVPLNYSGASPRDRLFYYGRSADAPDYIEQLRVYDKAGQPCAKCRRLIKRIVQGSRSTYYCPQCQR